MLQRMPTLPPPVSTYGAEIDHIYQIILVITGAIFVIVEVGLIYVVFKYRHREGRRAHFVHGNTRAEVVWTAIPFVLVVFIAAISMGPWLKIRDYGRFPTPDLELLVTAKQFEWNVTYPGADGRLNTGDDFTKRNRLDLPVNRNVVVTLQSEDVIHSFFLPDFRVKQDAVPGMHIPVWFNAIRTGDFVLGCAELCGNQHYRMKGVVTVHEGAAFDQWMQSGGTVAFSDGPATNVVAVDQNAHAGH
jgi:cytochrome c oxidase subunit II